MKRWLLVAGAVLVAGTAGYAQTMKSGQRIVFSQPDNGVTASNTVSLAPRSPELSPVANAIKPSPLNLNFQSAPPTPMPRPAPISPEQVARMRQAADKQKNWALMTPAEIMGVPTAAQIMGVPERDANGDIQADTVEDRYLARQMKDNNDQRTNGLAGRSDGNLDPAKMDQKLDFFGRPVDASRQAYSVFGDEANTVNGARGVSDELSGSRPANASSYSPYNAGASRTPDQVAAAKDFERLLQPTAMTQLKSESPVFPAPSAPSTGFRSLVNTPLSPFAPGNNSAVMTPTGVRPLLSTTDQKESSTTPVWKPQMPPWMLSTPQPGVMPQRKF
jgi:hypothetical protein